jgi:1,2-phenylacetyl-CoA epoxidase PaaB subunit
MPRELDDSRVFEVFLQTGTDGDVSHVGSLLAGDGTTAWWLAKDSFGRRDDVTQLWVVCRAQMVVSTPEDEPFLAAKSRMPHRQPAYPQQRRTVRDRTPPVAEVSTVDDDDSARLWAAVADDLFLHAHFLSACLYDFVAIETSLASGTIAQEALAHARSLVRQCGVNEDEIDGYFFDRPSTAWFPSGLWVHEDLSWPVVVARGLLLAAVTTTLAESQLRDGPGPEWAEVLDVVAREQAHHLEHWRGVVRGLMSDPELRVDIGYVFGALLAACGDVFGTPGAEIGDVRAHHELLSTLEAAGIPSGWCSAWPDYPRPRGAATASGSVKAMTAELSSIRAGYRKGAII